MSLRSGALRQQANLPFRPFNPLIPLACIVIGQPPCARSIFAQFIGWPTSSFSPRPFAARMLGYSWQFNRPPFHDWIAWIVRLPLLPHPLTSEVKLQRGGALLFHCLISVSCEMRSCPSASAQRLERRMQWCFFGCFWMSAGVASEEWFCRREQYPGLHVL